VAPSPLAGRDVSVRDWTHLFIPSSCAIWRVSPLPRPQPGLLDTAFCSQGKCGSILRATWALWTARNRRKHEVGVENGNWSYPF
jgi:hypothetical protein